MSTSNYKIAVKKDPHSRFFLIVERVDYELRLFWKRKEFFSVQKINMPSEPFELKLRRKYLLRYNNNDSGEGYLKYKILQSLSNGIDEEVLKGDLQAIHGPKVLEIPFMLWLGEES